MKQTATEVTQGRFRVLNLVAAAAMALASGAGFPQVGAPRKACDPAPAKVTSVQGTVDARFSGNADWRPLARNDLLCPGDSIRVGQRSRADISLLDQSVLRLNAGSAITVEAPKARSTGVVDLLRGAVHFFSRGARSLEVKTPFTIAGVRGTEFLVSLEPQQTLLTVFEGQVLAESAAGSLTLRDGESGIAQAGQPPVRRIVVRPRDAVHWTLYYPPVANFRPGEVPADILERPAGEIREPRLVAYRAQRLLAVGSVDEAGAEIGRALQLAPGNPDAASLQSIVALVQGDRDGALQIAQAAVEAAPASTAPLIARSYAQQATFDLEGARASAQRAVTLEPDNALAWARLAELHSSFGALGDARQAARRAAGLQPELSRSQTVLGFAELTAVDTARARASFEKAIGLDQADPLPRLGLGLAKIRDGDLDGGSREIEVAASLDPGNALVRSYLGKAYYEEKRSPLDEREYAMAQALDPKDPTPWFYDAIAKQTTNRPVLALQDVQKATELNDNRAVYRSRLLLDADQAARSAGMARIYSDLGFEQLALVEGWKSLNLDPGNFSAHRFLADSYSALPRHEIARVSELLQSQLLQPLNMTPLQPRLGESNLFLISAAGPGIASFSEFNPLFNRNGITFQGTGMAGEMDTRAAEGVIAGIVNNVGFSVGVMGYRTDGFRANADQRDDLANAFVQADLTPQTSVQAEYRHRETKKGDLLQRFFPEDFFPGERNSERREVYRAGVRHAFSPGSILLGSLTYQEANVGFRDEQLIPGLFVDFRRPEKASGAEVQHLYRSGRFKLTTGIGYFDIDGTTTQNVGLLPSGPLLIESVSETTLRHTNLYAYSYLTPLSRMTLTVGASHDATEGESLDVKDKRQLNPKLGLVWEPIPGTTLRAAAFRSVKRTLITNQTLEPTQVAGFNQFYDDINGTEARRLGAAIDQKVSRNVFAGAELSARKLDVPHIDAVTDPANPVLLQLDSREETARAYAFWTPHRSWALRAEYAFERFELPSTAGEPVVETHRVPLGVRVFHPSGVGASFTGTYYRQRGDFERPTGVFESGRDSFWIADAALHYRLPKRHGFVSIGARNLFDQEFRFYQTDVNNPTVLPARMVFLQATIAFP